MKQSLEGRVISEPPGLQLACDWQKSWQLPKRWCAASVSSRGNDWKLFCPSCR